MSLIRTSIKRPVTVCMITIGILAFGTISFLKLPINLLPDLSYPTLTLETRYPGAAPEEVEYLVTRPLEEAVAVIPNLKRVTSSSKPELSQVTLEFQWGRQMDFAILDVSKKVDLLRFPDDVEKPRILRYDPNQEPIMKVSVTGEMPLTDLRYFCEEDLKKRLDGVPGLASVVVIGGREEIIEVALDEGALKRFELSIEEVTTRLREENINRAGGSLYENEARYLVRTLNEFRSLKDIGKTIVSRRDDKRIYLSEIAHIRYGFKDQDHIARIGGEEGVELAFYKEGDANTVQVAKSLEKAIDHLKQQFHEKLSLTTTYKGASFIESAVDEVKSNAIIGGIIAILVLLLFLRDFRGTLIVGFAIPISIFTTFFLMLQFDVSMNIMSLGGLALGIGMLVDNSIVVLEAIAVRRDLGDDAALAAEKGTSLVSGAVVASTLTTVVVFLPIVFVQGISGQLFRDLGLTVTFSLLASLVVSLTLMPTLYALLARFGKASARVAAETGLEERDVSAFSGNLYSKFLTFCLRYRFFVLAASVLVVFQASQLYKTMGVSMVPQLAQGDYFVLLEMEEGTPIERTDKTAQWIEAQLLDTEGVAVVFSNIGEFNQGVETRSGENLAQINFALSEDALKSRNTIAAIRDRLDAGPALNYKIDTPSFFSFKTPVQVEIYNENPQRLREISDALMADLEKLSVLRDLQTSVADGNPEVQISFNRETMSKMGLSIGTIANLLRDKIQGTTPTRFVRSGRDVDILVRLQESDRSHLDQLSQMTVAHKDGRPIYLSSIADIRYELGPAQIKRINQKRSAIISAGASNSDLGAVNAAVQPILDKAVARYPGSLIQMSGQNAEMGESFKSLFYAILLAVFLVYLVMASQFESLYHPFLILFTIPIGLVGGLAALYISGVEISIIALIGFVMLAGIVVNNAIVLIDYINQLRRAGQTLYDALIIAGNRRLRPILMTTTTTILGLLPMAMGLGSGAELRTPLAITVIGGLAFSTLLTLILIPVLYGMINRGLVLPSPRVESIEQEVIA